MHMSTTFDEKTWKTIREHYELAKACLWCPEHADGWRRREDEGYYHLWNAYYMAVNSEVREDLLYARVLMMMDHETRNITDYDRYHKYIQPAFEAYKRAGYSAGDETNAEVKQIKRAFEELRYVLEKTSGDKEQIEQAYSLIDGFDIFPDFDFHDSKPIYFEHTKDRAVLRLEYDGVTAELVFEGLIDIDVNGDPLTNWIMDFYCYKAFHNDKVLVFDIGYYKILCESIHVKKCDLK